MLRAVVVERVDEHRHVELGPAQRVGHGALVAEVGQRDEHAVDPIAIGAEEIGAGARVGEALDGAERRLIVGERHGQMPSCFSVVENLCAAGRAEMRRKESTVADDDAEQWSRVCS